MNKKKLKSIIPLNVKRLDTSQDLSLSDEPPSKKKKLYDIILRNTNEDDVEAYNRESFEVGQHDEVTSSNEDKVIDVSDVDEYGENEDDESCTDNGECDEYSEHDEDMEYDENGDDEDNEGENIDNENRDYVNGNSGNSQRGLAADLAAFIVKSGMGEDDTITLLKLLNLHDVKNIPKTRKTLMKTPKSKVTQRFVSPGYFVYFGIEKSLIERKEHFKDLSEIEIDVGSDGASMFKSSALEIWPLMGAISNRPDIRPFLIGLYVGPGYPDDFDELFEEFAVEYKHLTENGIDCKFDRILIHKTFKVRLFTFDGPARSSICKIKCHSSYEGCPLCKMDWKIHAGKVVYTERVGLHERTDATFLERKYPEHHLDEYITKQSALEKLGVNMVSQIPIEPMHCIDLGAVYQELDYINDKDLRDEISRRILLFKDFCPSDFARDCRDLKYAKKFKATELRQFLLYGCIVFLKDVVSQDVYDHWLLLHVAIRLLSNPALTKHNIHTAEIIIERYVELYPQIYGDDSVTYNVHVLLHLCYYARLYGHLDSFSAYKFENFIQKLKSYVKKSSHTLQQINNRIEEEYKYNKESQIIPGFNSFDIICNEKDSFVAIKIRNAVFPAKVISKDSEHGTISVYRCLNIRPFYTAPIDSSELGEITYDDLHTEIEQFNLSDVLYKYCRIPYDDIFVLIPILHTIFKKFQH